MRPDLIDHRPLICDSFAGGGGASTGIEMSLGRSPDIAINHNPAALALHAANHPDTLHLSENVWQVDPLDYVRGRHVGLAWFSPDCKHFSKAKGGKPVERNIRDLAWVVVLWAERVRPDVILLENVEEFRDWGPLIETERGLMPDPDGRGKTFAKWLRQLRRLGYKVEWKELRACDYGAPTIRKRLFLIARCDGGKIVWPARTHGDPKKPADLKLIRAGRLRPWRTAAEIIDWTLPCPSIFDTAPEILARHGLRAVRPLAAATMSRVARGVDRYVLKAQRPFLVNLTHGARTEPADQPINTITGAHRGEKAVVAPSIVKFQTGSTGHAADEPLHTVTANSFQKKPGGAAPLGIVAASLTKFASAPGGFPDTEGDDDDDQGDSGRACRLAGAGHAEEGRTEYGEDCGDGNGRAEHDPRLLHPLGTADPEHRRAAAVLIQTGYGERDGQAPRALDPQAPLGTVVAGGVKHAAIVPTLVGCGGRAGQSRPRGSDEPAATITAKADVCLATAFVSRQFGGSIGHAAEDPTGTITADVNKTAVVAAFVAQHNNDGRREGGVNPGRPADEPVSTLTQVPQQGVVAASLMSLKGSERRDRPADAPHPAVLAEGGHSAIVAPHLMIMRNAGKPFNGADEPAHTVTAGGAGLTVVAPFMQKYYGTGDGARIDEPTHTVTVKDRFGFVEAGCEPEPLTEAQITRAREVAAFLRAHGFWDDREFVTVEIDGEVFTIVDIGMRMLTPRELFSAQGFPPGYVIDLEFNGKPLPKDAQISCCGNSVSPPVAAALAAANCGHLAEWLEAAE